MDMSQMDTGQLSGGQLSGLVNIVQLKNQLDKLFEQKQITGLDYNSMIRALDQLSFSLVEPVDDISFSDFVNEFKSHHPQIDLTPLTKLFRKQRFESLAKLRQSAINSGVASSGITGSATTNYIELGQSKVPLNIFSWNEKGREYQQILNLLSSGACDTEKLIGLIRKFFCPYPSCKLSTTDNLSSTDNRGLQLYGLPEFRSNLVRHLYLAKQIDNSQAMDFNQDEETVRTQLRDREAGIRQKFNQGEVLAEHNHQGEKELYHLLKKEILSPREAIPLSELILLWQGPNYFSLVRALFENTAQSQAAEELFFVRTGIDVGAEPYSKSASHSLKDWSEQGQQQEEVAYQGLLKLINRDRLIYDLLQMVSLSDLNDSPLAHQNRWLSVAQSLVKANQKKQTPETMAATTQAIGSQLTDFQVPETLAAKGASRGDAVFEADDKIDDRPFVDEKQPPYPAKKTQQTETPQAEAPQFAAESNQHQYAEVLSVDDATLLVAPQPEKNEEDLQIEEQSNWNQYVKPFLSENWLGLIGLCFIIAAWPILSMMVWDKSEYYRIAAGAIPLLFLTIGSAWITHFFTHLKSSRLTEQLADEGPTNHQSANHNRAYHNRASGNQKPVQLFACLTIWTIPFNLLMAISIYSSGLVLMACFMLLIYAMTIWLISPWLKAAYAGSPRNYLLVSHGILVLPIIIDFIFGNANRSNEAFGLMEVTGLRETAHLSEMTGFSMALVTYLLFFFYAKTTFTHFRNNDSEKKPFLVFLSTVHLAIALIALHIFYAQLPEIGTISVIVELIAIGLFYLSSSFSKAPPSKLSFSEAGKEVGKEVVNKTSLFVVAGAATVFGNLLAFSDPVYLLLTLPLSLIFWASLSYVAQSLVTQHKAWLFEVLAFHLLAIAAVLQFHLDFSGWSFYLLLLTSAVAIGLIESRFAKQEIKLLSFGIPLSLLLLSFDNTFSGANSISTLSETGGLILLMLVGGFNYHRASQLCQVGLWYTAVLLLVAMPLIQLEELHRLNNACVYLASVSLGWALLSARLKDIPALLNRTALLWLLCFLTSGILIYVAMKIRFAWDPLWFIALSLCLATNLLAAKRAQSLLPVYLSAVLIGIAVFWIKHEFEIVSKSGLGTAILALFLILSAPWLQATRFFRVEQKAERFFSRNFFLKSQQYLRLPLEQFAWLLIAVGFYKMENLFAPTINNFSFSLAALFHLLSLLILSVRYQKVWVSRLAFFPLLVFLSAVIVSMPSSYAPVCLVAMLMGWTYLVRWSQGLSKTFAIVQVPIAQAQTLLSYLFIPGGILGYLVLVLDHAAVWLYLVYGCMSLFYIERVFVGQGRLRFSHLNLIHIGLLWSLFFGLSFFDAKSSAWFVNASSYLLGFIAVLFIPAYIMEWFDRRFCRTYHQAIQHWLPMLAGCLMILLLSALMLEQQLSVTVISLSLLAFHLVNRAYHHSLLFLCKWLTSCLLIYIVLANPIYALLFGSFVFLTIEFLWQQSARLNKLQLQGIGNLNRPATKKIAQIGVLALAITLFIHLLDFAGDAAYGIENIWLYTLLPFSLYLYQVLKWEVLSYAVALIFSYANIFIALKWQLDFFALGLNSIHLLCAAMIVSILCLAAAVKFLAVNNSKVKTEVIA